MTDLARRTVLAGLAAAPLSLSADGARAQDMRRYICTTPDCRPYIYNPADGTANPIEGTRPDIDMVIDKGRAIANRLGIDLKAAFREKNTRNLDRTWG